MSGAVEIVRAALAEAGYPDADVYAADDTVWSRRNAGVPDAVIWRAYAVTAQPGVVCWPCWTASTNNGGYGVDCTHDTWDGAPPAEDP